ncbi:hypothetical protein [Kaistia sp. MMO-174]|uniref:hypothetical protein n=1 Tax=Kaistia sp. MMO-174 TaxID=3081256 RepID=UPI003018A912
MAGIYWTEGCARVRNFSAAVRSTGNSIVKVEIEVLDDFELGHLLAELKKLARPAIRKGRRSAPKLLEDLRGKE